MFAQTETRPPRGEPGPIDTLSVALRSNYIQPGAAEMSADWSLSDHLAHFETRMLADAFNEATSSYWERRAQAFDRARSRPGDYAGAASQAEIDARSERVGNIAEACRQAALVASYADIAELVATELAAQQATPTIGEVAA